MSKYLYPAGAIVNGWALAEPTVLTPCFARIEGILHGPEICYIWTDEALAGLGIKRVVEDALPTDSTGWSYLPGVPVDVEEDFQILRSFPNATPDLEGSAANQARLAAAARAERAVRLAASDWTQLPDAPLSTEQRAAWAVYRQSLRDVTEQQGFPASVIWPVAPGA